MPKTQVRSAIERDLTAIQAIYPHEVLHGLATFEEVPPTLAEMTDRWRATVGEPDSHFW